MRRTFMRIVAASALALIPGAAFAHAQLDSATPPVGGAVASPSEIRLKFSEGVEPSFSSVTLTSASGAPAQLGTAKTQAGDPTVLVAPVVKPLAPGVYTVRWRAVSVDTHHTQGDFDFTVKP